MLGLFEDGLLLPREIALPLFGSVLALVITGILFVYAVDYHHGWKRRRFLGDIPLMDDTSYLSPRLRLWSSGHNYMEGFARGYTEVIYTISLPKRYTSMARFCSFISV